jgi:hypothetical protein
MSKKSVTRGKLEVIEKYVSEPSRDIFTSEEKRASTEEAPTKVSSISIPEFLVDEPYPYFYHTWNKLLLCDLTSTEEIFHIQNDNDSTKPNIFIYNKQSPDNCSNFEVQHHKYGNSLQNYYSVIPQSGTINSEWKDEARINIANLTPVLLQKCDNIMTTLLFMPLDQCHDFRGGRTSGSSSWVTETSKGVLKKDVDIEEIAQGISENIYTNEFMNTLVNTSFSGKHNIVGIMVIGDDSFQALTSSESEYKLGDKLDIQKIMNSFGQMITIAGDIIMNCDPRGNRLRLPCGSKTAQIIFLGFTSDGWDKGMHDVWSMNEKKHMYYIKIDSIKEGTGEGLSIEYSGDILTIIENVVPCYEMLYKSKEEGDASAFMNNYQLSDGKKLSKSNFNEFFKEEVFDKLYSDFLADLYRTGKELHVDDDEDGAEGGSKLSEVIIGGAGEYEQSGIIRGATYKFYGVRAPDTKTSERMTPENRVRHIIFENLFIEILKKISKNISPQIHPDFKYPDKISNCEGEEENINERIANINKLYESIKERINEENIKQYSKEAYDSLRAKMFDDCSDHETDSRIIVKQFGTVNDMNIAPVIERVMDSLNCSDNCSITNVEKVEGDEEDSGANEEEESTSSAASTDKKKKDIKPCKTDIETNIRKDLNNKYPFKFQVVSGVLDSSMQGGENMPEYFPPEMDIFLTIYDTNSNLIGAVIRMTFLKEILKNTTNTKNNARVYSHFIYVGFDEINLECEEKLGADWKQNVEQYGFALKQLMNYVVKNTSFLPLLCNNSISNFELTLKDGSFRRWYFYFSDSAGPSVSEGINDVVKKIFSGQLGMISDDNIDVSESIVKVAQRIYMDSQGLREAFIQQPGSNIRSYAFESIFLLRIKYIGDKSRCTDSLFLNRNKYAECMQITGDENAYFTALVNGASTIYSPPSKFALYFAPYFTYGAVESEAKPDEPVGKFLLNIPIYKEILLKGESPSVFKITTSSSKKKSVDTDSVIPFESFYVKDKGPLKTGGEVRTIANEILIHILSKLDAAYFAAQLESRNIDNANQIEEPSKRSKQQRDIKKAIDNYVSYYNELEDMYNELKSRTLDGFIREIKGSTNYINGQYYSKLVEQLENVFIDNDFIIEQINLTGNDFQLIKQDITDFLTKSIDSMKKMTSETFEKSNPPLILDIDGAVVNDKKGNPTKLTQGAYNTIMNFIPMYEDKLKSVRQIEDAEELKTFLKELNEMYNKNIMILSGVPRSVIFWSEKINDYINIVLSISDIINHILPNIKAAKGKFASQTNKYDKFKPIMTDVFEKLPDLSKKKTPPKKTSPVAIVEEMPVATVEEMPVIVEEKPVIIEEKPVTFEEMPVATVEEKPVIVEEKPIVIEEEVPEKAKSSCIGDNCVISGGGDNESYRKNQIHILKCFSSLIKTNNDMYKNLISKNTFNYSNIDSIDKFCIAILLLQSYSSLNSFVPKLDSIENVIDEIAKLDESSSSLTDAINIRNYYSQIINNFIDIEYLEPDAIDYILNLYNVEIIAGDNTIYDLHKWTNIYYYLTTFIYNNLRAVNGGQFIDISDDNTFRMISESYNTLQSADIEEMSILYDASHFKVEIDKSDFIDEEEKMDLKKQIETMEQFEYKSLYLIKFCNIFVMKLTNNSLKDNLIYSYDTIIEKLTENEDTELIDKFNSIQINLEMSKDSTAKGIVLKKFGMPIKSIMPISKMRVDIPTRYDGVQAAGSGTYKANKNIKQRKTKGKNRGNKIRRSRNKRAKKYHKYTKKI